ncbi:hypothetical protein EVAR_99922_1 [Eumeta japonica]|uniref:Uncharacterized protein n=1 Tax=Eumeta variegata TaxID=151549 RepID=A0A4C1Z2J6_EUMVA|nr:hypothetical protein EVAR_99922_1 [Eumeta japonica]
MGVNVYERERFVAGASYKIADRISYRLPAPVKRSRARPRLINSYAPAVLNIAHHMLEACPVWAAQRAAQTAMAGDDLLLPVIVERITGNGESWEALRTFCGEIMSRKEAAE